MKTIALIGGGQLGKMLIQAGLDLNLQFAVLDPDENAPCATLTPFFQEGNLTDAETIASFCEPFQLTTYEIEHINTDALILLKKEGKTIYPQPHILAMIQDKILQKEFYLKHNFPTSPYRILENASQLEQHVDFLPAFQKLATGGYDGRGVQKMHSKNDFEKAFSARSVLEKEVDVWKEISILVARNAAGEISFFPLVEMVFHPEHNLVDYLLAPAMVHESIENEARAIAKRLVETLDFVGLLAVELFITPDQKVLINEIAPRPHNSGHHTIEACATSQFQQMLRAILNLPLGPTYMRSKFAAMVNLVGEPGFEGNATYEGLEQVLAQPEVYIHLYGKKQTRPFRKMGHITLLDNDLGSLQRKISFVKNTLKVKA